MIVLTLGGGLGNQMFQYAFARELQEQCGEEIKINNKELKLGNYKTNFLDIFNIASGITACSKEEEEYYWKKQMRIEQLSKIQLKLFPQKAPERVKYFSKRFGYFHTYCVYTCEPYTLVPGKLKLVVGGYQTWKYWKNMENKIKKEMLVKGEPLESDRQMLEEISQNESVCVHMRRGDYVNDKTWNHLNICNEQYYSESIKKMAEKLKNPVFYIFSNNSEELMWIKENYRLGEYDIRYVDQKHSDYEELRMMYHCKHFIISNSTFSWWAQYLASNQGKVVIAPSKWNNEENAEDIYMPEWEIVEVE